MARIVKHEANGPLRMEVEGKPRSICMCGLSDNKPFCDGSHKQTSEEQDGHLYVYEDGQKIPVTVRAKTCCGGGCGCSK